MDPFTGEIHATPGAVIGIVLALGYTVYQLPEL